jgi:hypothetical protein
VPDLFDKIFHYYFDNTNSTSAASAARKRRQEVFIKTLEVDSTTQILDVGGSEGIWIGSGLEKNVTILNLAPSNETAPFRYVHGDACNMKNIKDYSYDVVFSNSVIEHVGGWENQNNYAHEINRIGKKCWVQTPNKYFPVEPHLAFPLFQFMPDSIQKFIALRWNYSHIQRNGGNVLEELGSLHLLGLSDMRRLFPGFEVYKEKYLGLTKSIVVYKT